jgi:hypothetical protein
MKRIIAGISVILMLCGCSGKNSVPSATAPAVTILTTPALNAVCTTGTVLSATQSTITFTWNAAAYAQTYDLYLKNLLTAVTTTQSDITGTTVAITLLRGTPYSWYIVSKTSKSTTTAQSATWKFYNAGIGVVTYAPFPAAIISPTFAQNVMATAGTINLSWTGSSVNTGSIAGYDIYLSTSATPALLKSGVTDSFLNGVAVTSGTTYYWRVITKDTSGDTSDSGVYQFKVN